MHPWTWGPCIPHLLLYLCRSQTMHKEKTYGRVLKTRVSEVWRQTVLRDSPRVTDGSPPQGRMHTTFYRIRTQDQNIIPTQEPRPNGVPQTQYGDRRCPLCPGRHLGSEAHLYLSCTVTSPTGSSTHLRAPRSFPVGWLHATTADGTSPRHHASGPRRPTP